MEDKDIIIAFVQLIEVNKNVQVFKGNPTVDPIVGAWLTENKISPVKLLILLEKAEIVALLKEEYRVIVHETSEFYFIVK